MSEANDYSPGTEGVPPQNENQREWMLENLRKAREARSRKAAERRTERELEKKLARERRLKEKSDIMVAKKQAVGVTTEDAGPDVDKLNEIIATYPQVSCDIRHFVNNNWKTVHDNFLVDPKELHAFSAQLIALEGGGKYSIRVRDPNNLGEQLMPKFYVHINQPPRSMPSTMMSPAVPDLVAPMLQPSLPPVLPPVLPQAPPPETPVMQPPYPQQPYQQTLPPLPPQYRNLPPDQQWAFYNAMQQSRSPGIEAAGQVALQQVTTLTAEKGSLQAQIAAQNAKIEADRRFYEERFATFQREQERMIQIEREKAARAEAEAKEQRHRAEVEAQQQRFEASMREMRNELVALKTAPAVAKSEDKSTLALFIPVIVEWIKGSSSRDEAERTRSMENMKFLLQAVKKEPGAEVEVMKTLMEMVKSKGDEKIQEAESKVLMLGAISNFIKEREGEPPPPWLQVVEPLVEGLKGVGIAMVAKSQQVPGQEGQAPPKALPGTVTEGQAPMPAPSLDEQRMHHQFTTFMQVDEQAAKLTAMAFASEKMPAEMHTTEWRYLIFNLHHKNDIDKLVEITVDYLETQRAFGLLPAAFKEVFAKPELVGLFIQALPIYSIDKEYAEKFIAELVDEIKFRENERLKVEEEEKEEAQIETQAEAANGN